MYRVLLFLCACLLLAGFAWPDAADMLGKRLVAPGGTSPILPTARIEDRIARLPHRRPSWLGLSSASRTSVGIPKPGSPIRGWVTRSD